MEFTEFSLDPRLLKGIEALDLGNADMYSEVIDEIQRKLFRSTEVKQEENE